MANLNNPAGRLLYWLELGDQRPKGESAMGQWCVVFGLDASKVGDRAECARRGTMLAALGQAARREAEQLPEMFQPAVMLTHFNEVESALDQFTILPSTTMQQMFAQMQGTGWQSLRMLDAILSTQRPEHVIDEGTKESLIEQVRSLIDEVTDDSDLALDLKQFILRRLEEVERALRETLLTGTYPVEQATDALIGAMRRRPDMWDRIAQTKWAPRLGKIAGALCLALGSAGGLPALMPGDAPQPPAIHTTVEIDTDVTEIVPEPKDEDIHEAEILEDEDGEADAG
ncbi:hypothetical protein ACW14X_00395 [Nocardioides sp. YJ-D4]